MFKSTQLNYIIFSLFLIFSSLSYAEKNESLSAFSIIPPVQYPVQGKGALSRFSVLYGQHAVILGLDVGLLGNMTDQLFIGSAFSGLFNINSGKTIIVGGQVAGLTNWIKGDLVVAGVQLSAGVNYVKGTGHVAGLQFGLLGNIAPKTNIYGVQIGLYNEADNVYGFQIGLVNIAKRLHGIQLGLFNIQHEGAIRFMPAINIGF